MPRPYRSEDWMREKYHGEGMTLDEIAEEADASSSTISRWMNNHGIDRRDPNKIRSQKAKEKRPRKSKLKAEYHDKGKTLSEIAKANGVSRSVVIRWMDELEIERRTSAESRKERGTGTNQFDHGPHREEEWLREKYWTEQLTLEEMAEEAGIESEVTILRQMEKHGIDRREKSVAFTLSNPGAGFVQADASGYETIKHSVGDTTKNFKIHRLVAMAEYGIDAVKDSVVHHKNGVKWDNRPENLEVLSDSEHAKIHSEERERDELGRLQ